jgi:hypothetical protein
MFGGTDLLSDPRVFWNSYKACEDSAFEQATPGPDGICVLVEPMEELLCYHKLSEGSRLA